ncbi:glycosyltransferase family 4 protein [archaeon]|nr:glycosyltransferase family 4 protein [archaeon]
MPGLTRPKDLTTLFAMYIMTDIIYLLTKFPPRAGGSGSMAYNTAKRLSRKHSITIFTQWYEGLPLEEQVAGFTISRIKNPLDGSAGFAYLIAVAALKASFRKADIIHFHDITMAMGNNIASRISGKDTIIKYGGDFVAEYLSERMPRGWRTGFGVERAWDFNLEAKAMSLLQKDALASASHVYANSDYGSRLAGQILGRKIAVIRNGVDMKEFDPAVFDRDKMRRKLGVEGRAYLVASRMVKHKGIEDIIRAFKRAGMPKSLLMIAGDGPEKGNLLRLAAGDRRIRFLGNVDWREMPSYLAACDVFVLGSHFEWCPNALLEAMAMGKTVIASDTDGSKEIITEGKNGLLYRRGSMLDLEKKVRLAMDSDFGKTARLTVKNKFSLDAAVARTEKIYRSLS